MAEMTYQDLDLSTFDWKKRTIEFKWECAAQYTPLIPPVAQLLPGR